VSLSGAALMRWLRALLDWRPFVLMALCATLLLILGQQPQRYSFDIGRVTGVGTDTPFMQGFYPHERSAEGVGYRWSKGDVARIEIPGLGRRGVLLEFDVVSHREQWFPEEGQTLVTIRSGQMAEQQFPLRLEGASYRLYLPPEALSDGVLRLDFHSPAWEVVGDNRTERAVAIGGKVRVTTLNTGGFVLPDLRVLLGMPVMLLLLWITLRTLRFSRQLSGRLLLPLAIVAPFLMLLDAPRLGFGGIWMMQFGALNVISAIITMWFLPPLLQRLKAPASAQILSWLALCVVLSFTLKYGGRLYPESMPGDVQLHVNRYTGTMIGQVYIPAQHRGLPFPFPTGPYILVAPFTLPEFNIKWIDQFFDVRWLLQFTAGLYEAATVITLFVLVARIMRSERLGLWAGAAYLLVAVGYMNTWFAFETQVASQWFALVLFAVLVLAWPNYSGKTWLLLFMLLVQVFVGHIGLFMNVGLLSAMVLPWLWWRLRDAQSRRAVAQLFGIGFAAVAFVMLFFYTGFSGMIIEQVSGVFSSGLNEVTGRAPIPRETTLWVTWEGGLITHYGFFPILLMIPGLLWLGRKQENRPAYHPILMALLWGTLIVSFAQMVLPLITLSSITTRWLTFAAWAIILGGVVGLDHFRKRGRAAKIVSWAMIGYIAWITIVVFAEAMALHKPPIEPF
jgi:hypothetical protein